jgi:MerR family transcriptional regulator, redox-sensitive transcriptional activator SoxR
MAGPRRSRDGRGAAEPGRPGRGAAGTAGGKGRVVSAPQVDQTVLRTTDLLTVGEIARRSGFAESAVRYYERLGLLTASRTAGGQRRFERSMLRRLAFIRAARNVGLSLTEVAEALESLPAGRTPTRADWTRLSRGWRQRLDDQIDALTALRDGLDSCIGCGCLSLQRCAFSNPADTAGAAGPGAAYLPAGLRRDDSRLAGPPR